MCDGPLHQSQQPLGETCGKLKWVPCYPGRKGKFEEGRGTKSPESLVVPTRVRDRGPPEVLEAVAPTKAVVQRFDARDRDMIILENVCRKVA